MNYKTFKTIIKKIIIYSSSKMSKIFLHTKQEIKQFLDKYTTIF